MIEEIKNEVDELNQNQTDENIVRVVEITNDLGRKKNEYSGYENIWIFLGGTIIIWAFFLEFPILGLFLETKNQILLFALIFFGVLFSFCLLYFIQQYFAMKRNFFDIKETYDYCYDIASKYDLEAVRQRGRKKLVETYGTQKAAMMSVNYLTREARACY